MAEKRTFTRAPVAGASVARTPMPALAEETADAARPVVVPADLDPRLAGTDLPKEIGGYKGPEPTRFGDWEHNGRCTDF